MRKTRLQKERLKDQTGKFGNYRSFIDTTQKQDPRTIVPPMKSSGPRFIIRKKASA